VTDVWNYGGYDMKTWRCELIKDIIHLDYQELRQSNSVAARQATLQVLKAHDGNICKAASILNLTRATVTKT